jgi:hypothetical protein
MNSNTSLNTVVQKIESHKITPPKLKRESIDYFESFSISPRTPTLPTELLLLYSDKIDINNKHIVEDKK